MMSAGYWHGICGFISYMCFTISDPMFVIIGAVCLLLCVNTGAPLPPPGGNRTIDLQVRP